MRGPAARSAGSAGSVAVVVARVDAVIPAKAANTQAQQAAVMRRLVACRTAALGGHIDVFGRILLDKSIMGT